MFDDYNAVRRLARTLGAEEAKGALKRPEFYHAMCVAVEQGKVDAKGIHEAAAELWSDFASNKKRAEIMGDLVVSTDPGDKVNAKTGKSSNVRASELRQIMTAASKTRGNTGFSDTLTEARAVIVRAKRTGDYKGNTQDAFVSIARAQLKVEDRPLTDDEIYAAVCPAPKAKDRTEKKELSKLATALEKLIKGTEGTETSLPKEPMPSEEASAALKLLNERIAVLTLRTPK
jgi:cobalamin biosynthesis protein CobT